MRVSFAITHVPSWELFSKIISLLVCLLETSEALSVGLIFCLVSPAWIPPTEKKEAEV